MNNSKTFAAMKTELKERASAELINKSAEEGYWIIYGDIHKAVSYFQSASDALGIGIGSSEVREVQGVYSADIVLMSSDIVEAAVKLRFNADCEITEELTMVEFSNHAQ